MTPSRSGGPRTPEGKAASSRNAIKHGLTARQTVIEGENQADFDALLESIAADRKPEGELEIQAVGEIAACTWRLARARAKEAEVLGGDEDLMVAGTAPGFDRLLRYMGSIERQLNRAIVRLRELQTGRAKRQHVQEADRKPLVMAAGAANSTTCAQPEFVSSNGKGPLSAQAVDLKANSEISSDTEESGHSTRIGTGLLRVAPMTSTTA